MGCLLIVCCLRHMWLWYFVAVAVVVVSIVAAVVLNGGLENTRNKSEAESSCGSSKASQCLFDSRRGLRAKGSDLI